jgi:adenine specific DNA methylase Mod
MTELKVRNMENLEKYLTITLPPNKLRITPFLFSTDKKDREMSFFFDKSSEVYAR